MSRGALCRVRQGPSGSRDSTSDSLSLDFLERQEPCTSVQHNLIPSSWHRTGISKQGLKGGRECVASWAGEPRSKRQAGAQSRSLTEVGGDIKERCGLRMETPVPKARLQDSSPTGSIGDVQEHAAGPQILYLPVDPYLQSTLVWDWLRN